MPTIGCANFGAAFKDERIFDQQAVFTLIDCTGLKTRLYPDIVYRLLFFISVGIQVDSVRRDDLFKYKKRYYKEIDARKKYNNIKVFETKNIY